MNNKKFSHLDEHGQAKMVDVGEKIESKRLAVAKCKVSMAPETLTALKEQSIKKGDVLAIARIAGIQAAKRTSELIPLCHPIFVNSVVVDFKIISNGVEIESTVESLGRTGVEMEALTACSVASLTIYDMCKSLDRSMTVENLGLWKKTGGKSGDWERQV
mgnify:CR=1 FL=1